MTARAEVDDEAALLGDPEELVGAEQPALGMLPADERLERLDRAGRERDDRLVVDDDLVALERAAQLDRELLPLAEALVEPRLVDRVMAALVALRDVHRDVGVAEKLLGRRPRASPVSAMPMLACALVSRPASQNGSASASRIRCATCSASASVRVREKDAELVAAEPGRRVAGPHRVAQALGDLHEHLVADGVAPAVVDELEAVEIEEEDGARRVVGRGALHGLGDARGEERAVRQAGESVVVRLMPQLLLQLRHLRERLLEAAVLEQDGGVAVERLEEHEVVLVELRHVADPAADEEKPEDALVAAERADDAVREAAGCEEAVEGVRLALARQEDRALARADAGGSPRSSPARACRGA